jgi:hypothetical protein
MLEKSAIKPKVESGASNDLDVFRVSGPPSPGCGSVVRGIIASGPESGARGNSLMDLVTSSLLRDFCKEYDLTHLAEDKQFETMAAYLTVRRHYSETFAPSDIVVGAGGDLGIDAVAIIVNATLVTDLEALKELLSEKLDHVDATFVFVQAERSPGFEASKLGNFVYGVKEFFNKGTKEPRNKNIIEAMQMMTAIFDKGAKFKRVNPRCLLYYVTTGFWPEDGALPVRRESFAKELVALQAFREVEITPIGAAELSQLFRLSKNSITREFSFGSRQEVPEIPGVREAFVGFIPASEFLSIVKNENGDIVKSIFYDNVRDFQAYNDVNTEIRDTLTSETRKRFVLMNNGITIITRDLAHTRDKFTIADFQIVNGCQTTHVLFEHEEKVDESVIVPLRLIWTQDERVIEDIIHATNRQTEVKPDQFFAITDFARTLEDYFSSYDEPERRLYFERRSRQYDRLDIEKTRIVIQTNVVRSFASMFMEEPHSTIRSYRSLSDRIGKDIFAKEHKPIAYYTAAFALYRLEWLFRNGQIDSSYKIARFQILMVARMLINDEPVPFFNAHAIDKFCQKILAVLWDKDESIEYFIRAIMAIDGASDLAGTLDRDTIHTQTFTSKLKEECKLIIEIADL